VPSQLCSTTRRNRRTLNTFCVVLSDLRLNSGWNGEQCAQCKGGVRILHTESVFPFCSISPRLPFAELGTREWALVEVTSLLIFKEMRAGGALFLEMPISLCNHNKSLQDGWKGKRHSPSGGRWSWQTSALMTVSFESLDSRTKHNHFSF